MCPRHLHCRASREEASSGHDQGEPAGSHGGCVIVVLPRREAWPSAVLLYRKADHRPDLPNWIRSKNSAASGVSPCLLASSTVHQEHTEQPGETALFSAPAGAWSVDRMIKLFSVKVRVMCLKADTSEVRHEAVDCIHSSCRCLERMWQEF